MLIVVMVALAILLPLFGLSLIGVLLLESLVLRRFQGLATWAGLGTQINTKRSH